MTEEIFPKTKELLANWKRERPSQSSDLLSCLSAESLQDIANAANRLKEREYMAIGQIATPITAGDVRVIMAAYAALLAR